MENENLSPEQSLEIINQMVRRAQNNLSNNGFYFIFWGWLVFVTSILFYLLIEINCDNPWMVWMLMFAGCIYSIVHPFLLKRKNEEKAPRMKTYVETYLGYLWIAFGISLFIVLSMGFCLKEATYPVVIMLYGIGTFVSGGLLNFSPLKIGGACNFGISVLAFLVNFKIQILLLSLSLLISYIIPGHLLRNKFNNRKSP